MKRLLRSILKKNLAYQLRGMLFTRRGWRYGGEWKSRATNSSSPELPNALLKYFDAHQSGPGIFKWRHYFEIYKRHLGRFVGRDARVLEVGIFSGGSLPMWRAYFGEHSLIYGVDIEPACKVYEDERTRVFIGDQASRDFWRNFKGEVPTIDVLLDDGGHQHEQQIVTLEEMLPHLAPGGVYLCEDVHGEHNPFQSYVCGLAARLNAMAGGSGDASRYACETTPLQSAIYSVHLYPFITVIERRERPLDLLVTERHGTDWQPFL